jgi:hypothetical protein
MLQKGKMGNRLNKKKSKKRKSRKKQENPRNQESVIITSGKIHYLLLFNTNNSLLQDNYMINIIICLFFLDYDI